MHSSSFFRSGITFTWNILSSKEWDALLRLFVESNIEKYDDSLTNFAIEQKIIDEETKQFEKIFKEKPEVAIKKILYPLYSYMDFEEEWDTTYQYVIRQICTNKNWMVHEQLKKLYNRLLNLTIIKNYFIAQFQIEKELLQEMAKAGELLQFLTIHCNNLPIGFFSCAVNHDTGGVFLRKVILSPGLLGDATYGKRIFNEIQKHFHGYRQLESYTSKFDITEQYFYEACEFHAATKFDSFDPENKIEKRDKFRHLTGSRSTLYYPNDAGIAEDTKNKFIGFIKRL